MRGVIKNDFTFAKAKLDENIRNMIEEQRNIVSSKEITEILAAEERKVVASGIYHKKNANRGVGTLDLHRLYVKEALIKVEERIELLRKLPGLQELTIIVGKGKHSEEGVSKLKPEVLSTMENYKKIVPVFSAKVDPLNQGKILVSLHGDLYAFV